MVYLKAIVLKSQRESKENHEEPTRAEMFTATRTNEIQHRIEAGEDDEDAFISVLGKDQPGRLRCYGGGITKSSLKKDVAVHQVQVEYDKKVLSLQNQMHSMQGILKMVLQQLNPGMTDEDVAALV
ncbi:hypothetical protein PIB30_095796 [Stylosanthes scabra]|uniref:Uncharacterized protein n=1 Tax=Stylosanthes scabra TaxID=79078 RepID=A0ABU6WVS9_9FABA|nr:hypothetical protein [Stylosanthes scabra]